MDSRSADSSLDVKCFENTTKQQFRFIVEFMKKYPFLATNGKQNICQGRFKKNQLWERLTKKLNSMGPPVRTKTHWKKVWADLKNRTKKKESKRLNSMKKTGGGPYENIIITGLESDIIEVAALNTALRGVPNVKRFGVSSIDDNDALEALDFKNYSDRFDGFDKASILSSSNNSQYPTEYLEVDYMQEDTNEFDLDRSFSIQQNETQEGNKDITEIKMDILKKDMKSKEKFRSELLFILKDIRNTLNRGIEQREKQHNDLMEIERKKLKLREFKYEFKTLNHLKIEDVLNTFGKYKDVLNKHFFKYRNSHKVPTIDGLDYMALQNFIPGDHILRMSSFLKEIYETENTEYSVELYFKLLVPEWVLSIFMDEYGFNRQEALQQIADQETKSNEKNFD